MPDWVAAASVAALVLVLLAFYTSWRASRLDGLHTRLETARSALDTALARRHTVVGELAALPGLDPASQLLLAEAVAKARRSAASADRNRMELAESALSRTLRAVLDDAGVRPVAVDDRAVFDEVAAEARRTLFARRFYNDAVAATRHARSRRLVRWLRLAGGAPSPEFFEIDDEPPAMSDRASPGSE
ncbi:hypothetical protein J4H86_25580 [Spiractinospora alimapuensis]|nr:hypothetical protein [Spiractinospora alimapuensis]QVQ55162.1 hypothetical protein J4H86_25580 [Spiractinospora alimapuensis]